MEKRREFSRTSVEVCRNCKADGYVSGIDVSCETVITKCPICGGSGLIKKTTVGMITVEPYEKNARP